MVRLEERARKTREQAGLIREALHNGASEAAEDAV